MRENCCVDCKHAVIALAARKTFDIPSILHATVWHEWANINKSVCMAKTEIKNIKSTI